MALRTSKFGRCIIALLLLFLVVVLLDRAWFAHIRKTKERLRVGLTQLGMTREELRAVAGEPAERHESLWIYRYRQPMCQHGSPLVEFLLWRHVVMERKVLRLTFSEYGTVSRISGSGGTCGMLPRDLLLLFDR